MISLIGLGTLFASLASDSSRDAHGPERDLLERLGVDARMWPPGPDRPAWVVCEDAYEQTLDFWRVHCATTADLGTVMPGVIWVALDDLPPGSYSNEESYHYSLDRLRRGLCVRPVLFGHDLSRDGEPYLIDGRHRLAAAETLGFDRVPVLAVKDYDYEGDDL